MPARRASTALTQRQCIEWGKKRPEEGRRLAKVYERQGAAIKKLIEDHGCSCDPIIWLPSTGDGPTFSNPQVTHTFDCERR